MTFYRDSTQAFNEAIRAGNLQSENANAPRYAGNYMYMFSSGAGAEIEDHFKNIDTRDYIEVKSQPRNY
jgi:hypothetical protein